MHRLPNTSALRRALGRPRRARALLVAVIATLAVSPAIALAATQPVERFHDRVTDSFSDEICGIAVDVQLAATNNVSLYADGSFKATGSFRATGTNPINGKGIVISSAGQASGAAPVIDEQAGTITFFPSFKGLAEKIQTANGPVLLRDAGVITFADTFDLQSGEFVSSETIVDKGPHPEADSDFTRFCDVIRAGLT